MKKSVKKLNELERKLNTKDVKVISNAIILLRNEEPYSGAIHLLVTLYDSTNNLLIRDLINNFMIDLKEPEVREEIITEVKMTYRQETICMLVSSCWQSGLDYTEYSNDFANIFIRGDYKTALECFTIIGESVKNMERNKKIEIIELLEKNKDTFSVEKASLSDTIVASLR